MKRELPHFYIGSSYGGNQDWFSDFMMRLGGCAAETACDCSIYFDLYRGTKLYPFLKEAVSREDYCQFASVMKPYISPRWQGVHRLDMFTGGYGRFLRERGEERLSLGEFPGEKSFEEARDFVKRQIDSEMPIPCLVLYHKDPRFEDYVWHWFLLNGYREDAEGFFVKAVTYSEYEWLDFEKLWDTGHARKGGLIEIKWK